MPTPSSSFLTEGSHTKCRGDFSRVEPSSKVLTWVGLSRCTSFALPGTRFFTHLNRIPGVLSVQGYIDDATIAGDGQCLGWLGKVSDCYLSLRSAGSFVDPHGCFRACVTTRNRMPPAKCLSDVVDSTWPGLISSRRFPTVWAALSDHFRPGYNTVVVRVGGTCSRLPESAAPSQMQCVVGVFTYQQISGQGFTCTSLVHILPLSASAKASPICLPIWPYDLVRSRKLKCLGLVFRLSATKRLPLDLLW